MILTKMTRFGTRAVFDMAYNSSGLPVRVNDIARRQEIPLRFLEQIFHRLKKADFIKSLRGPGGGYMLTKDPSKITVGDIAKAVDESLDLIDCIIDEKSCIKIEQCPTRPIWEKTSEKIKEYLHSVTIANMCRDAKKKGVKKDSNQPFDYNI